MNDKIQALNKNETWDLVPHSPHKKAICCRWTFKVKYNDDGSIKRYKVGLVTKGYAQTDEVDYEETFGLMSKTMIVWIVIALATAKGWHLYQMDVKNTSQLQGELEEEVFIILPPNFESSKHSIANCQLKKPLYGLK